MLRRSLSEILVVAALSMAVPAFAKLPNNNALANDLIIQAKAAAAANKPNEALDLYEAAMLANPASAVPFVGMARTYEGLGLPGKALRYYREALDINPNDVSVLESQAMLMIAKGNVEKARTGLARIKKLCAKTACPSVARVDAALAKAGTQTSMNGRIAPQRIMTTKPPVAMKPAAKPAPKKN